MHYKNGRAAKAGDRVIDLQSGQAGILHSTSAASDSCNGRLALTTSSDPYVTIKECVHVDDVKAGAGMLQDESISGD